MELCTPFLGHPAPCSIRYCEPLTLVLFEGAERIEKVGERSLFPTAQDQSLTSPPGLWILLPQRLPMSNTNFYGFPRSLKVRSSARQLAQSFQMLLHCGIPRLDFLPRIQYSRFSMVFLCLEL